MPTKITAEERKLSLFTFLAQVVPMFKCEIITNGMPHTNASFYLTSQSFNSHDELRWVHHGFS